MERYTDQSYLLSQQYGDAKRLEARIALHERFSTSGTDLNRWLFDLLEVPVGGSILELGCGSGRFWYENSERTPADWSVLLSDFSPGMLSRAREALAEVEARFTFEQIDAQEIPAAGGSFDVVVANYMLYHVPDSQRAFSEIRRVLKPGGRLYAATNGVGHMKGLEQYYRHLDPDYRRMSEPFNLENAAEQLTPFFEVVDVRHFEDGLVVTETEPLVDYILSTLDLSASQQERIPGIRRLIQEQIEAQGAVRIAKSTGQIECRRA